MSDSVLHLAEIVLWTRDMDRSLAFYRDLFGLTVSVDREQSFERSRLGCLTA